MQVHIATLNEKRAKLQERLEKFHYPKDVVVRLGGTKAYHEYPVQINSAVAVLTCIDKLKSKEIMLKKGIPTLPIYMEPIDFPSVIKGRVRSGGTSVFLMEDKGDFRAYAKILKQGFYVEPYFDYTSEYRLHCTKKECFFAVKKIKDVEGDAFVTAKNHHNVRDFVKPRRWKEIQEASIQCIKALGLDIGAIDVGYCSNTNPHTFIIHEANSNPELLTNTFEAYVSELDKLIREKL